jgi:hypothetical protein
MRIKSIAIFAAMITSWLVTTDTLAETVFKVWHRGSQDLLKSMRRIDGLDVSFTIQGPTHVFVHGHLDVKHRCIQSPKITTKTQHRVQHELDKSAYPIGVGVRLEHVDQTGTSRWVQGAKWGPNIASCAHHYVTIPLDGYICLTVAGTHRISVWATAHSDAIDYDGIAEVSPASDSDQSPGTTDPYNQMIVRVVPTTSC